MSASAAKASITAVLGHEWGINPWHSNYEGVQESEKEPRNLFAECQDGDYLGAMSELVPSSRDMSLTILARGGFFCGVFHPTSSEDKAFLDSLGMSQFEKEQGGTRWNRGTRRRLGPGCESRYARVGRARPCGSTYTSWGPRPPFGTRRPQDRGLSLDFSRFRPGGAEWHEYRYGGAWIGSGLEAAKHTE